LNQNPAEAKEIIQAVTLLKIVMQWTIKQLHQLQQRINVSVLNAKATVINLSTKFHIKSVETKLLKDAANKAGCDC